MKKHINKKLVKRISAFLCMALLLVGSNGVGTVVYASEQGSSSDESADNQTTNADENGNLGKNQDIGFDVAKSISGQPGKKTKISFTLKSGDKANIKIKDVYPIIDSSFPFETSGDAYKVVKAGNDAEKQAKLAAKYTLTARGDLPDGYQSIQFMVEYTKTDAEGVAADYYVIKTINISFADKSSKNTSDNFGKDDDDYDYTSYPSDDRSSSGLDDGDKEVTAPKLLLTGFETEPKKIMAGDTFTLTIHVQNTSKSTPVCNGKFLIGNEAGTFLPTSGSSAVYVEKIGAGETGDLKIEMKTAADLPQKTYILVVKGDFDDGKGNTFTSSDNLSVPVYQEVKLGVSDISMNPSAIGIGDMGSLMFTLNNQGSAGVYNVSVAVDDEAVTAEDSYVGNIAGSSSSYVTMNVKGEKDNSDVGTIKIVINYEDSEGNAGKLEQNITCNVGEGIESEDVFGLEDGEADFDEYGEDTEEGIPWWVYVIIGVVAVALIVLIVVLVIRNKKKRAALLEDDDDIDGEDEIENEDF